MISPRFERGVFVQQVPDAAPGGSSALEVTIIDARRLLSLWYGGSAIYVDTVERDADGRGGVGRFLMTEDQCNRQKDPSFTGDVVSIDEKSIVSELLITAEHARDHFREGRGTVLPGHKTIRIALNTMEQLAVHVTGKSDLSVRLLGFESVAFSRPVLPGKTMRISIALEEGDESSSVFQGRAEVTIDGQPAAVIERLGCEVTDEPQDGLLEDQLIEAGIQAAGLTALEGDKLAEGSLPAFARIGKANFYERPKPGEAVWSAVNFVEKSTGEHFAANVTLLNETPGQEERILASFADAEAFILTPARARKIFGQPAA